MSDQTQPANSALDKIGDRVDQQLEPETTAWRIEINTRLNNVKQDAYMQGNALSSRIVHALHAEAVNVFEEKSQAIWEIFEATVRSIHPPPEGRELLREMLEEKISTQGETISKVLNRAAAPAADLADSRLYEQFNLRIAKRRMQRRYTAKLDLLLDSIEQPREITRPSIWDGTVNLGTTGPSTSLNAREAWSRLWRWIKSWLGSKS